MHSSISNSETGLHTRQSLSRGTWALFVSILLLLAGAELISSVVFNRISRIQRRMLGELSVARAIRPAQNGESPTMLLIGNSLLLQGVDGKLLEKETQPAARTVVLPIESTSYNDMYYSLQRLFHEGMRPEYVVLCLGTTAMTSPTIRGDYAAYYLFDAPGIVEYVRKTGTHPTEGSNLLFAHYSAFYGSRQEFRGFLLFRIIPGLFAMNVKLIMHPGEVEDTSKVIQVIEPRMRALRELSAQYGSKFVYVIVPCRQEGEDATVEAGRNAGVPVLLPIRNFELSLDYYSDRFHLNQKGAALFTGKLAAAFKQLLAGKEAGEEKRPAVGHDPKNPN